MRVQGLSLPLPESDGAPPARHGGWAPRVLAAIVALALAVLAIAALDLNRPWVKRYVQGYVRSSWGLDVDYRSARLRPLSGVEVDDLVVRSAPGLRELAPDLVRAGHVAARWSPSSLLGHGPGLERITVSDVALAVVFDEHGRTSLDAVRVERWPWVPLSYRPGQLLSSTPIAARFEVARASLAVIWTRGGRVVERDGVRGLGASLAAEPDRSGWRVRLAAGTVDAPLDLELTRERAGPSAGAARARFSLGADVSASALGVACDLRVLEQSLVPSIELGDWHAEVSARFDPAARRTAVTLDRVRAAAGAATIDASLEVPDEGDPIVRHAQGDFDVARLLAWIPAGVVPVAAERARLHYRVDSAALGWPPRLTEGGGVHVDADLSGAKVRTSAGSIDVDGWGLVLDARPVAASDMAVRVWQMIDGARVESREGRLDVRGLAIDLDGVRAGDGTLTGRLDLRFGRLRQEAAGVTVLARDGRLGARLERLFANRSEALRTRGDVAVSADVTSLDARLPGGRVLADSVALEGHGRLEGHPPYGGEVDASAAGLQVFAGGKRLVARAPARAGIYLHDVFLDADHPLASRGVVRASVDLGRGRASLDAVKRADSLDYTLHAAAGSLRALRPFLPPGLADAAGWDTMAIALSSRGRVERLARGDPEIEQDTSLDVERPALGGLSARSAALVLHSRGTASRHQATANLRLSALAIGGGRPGDDTVALSAAMDRAAGTLRLQASVEGRVNAQADASVSFDRDARAVLYDVSGRLSDLAPIAPLLARVRGLDGFDVSRLELGLASRGALLGVVSNVGPGGAVELEPDPLRTAAVDGTADVRIAMLRWVRGDTGLEVPVAGWHGDLRSDGARRTLEAHADIDSARFGLGRHQVDLAGISDDATLTVTGDLRDPTFDLTQRAAIRGVQQDFVVEYPVGDVTVALSARRDRDGVIRVSSMNVRNGSGGTTLAMEGGVDLASRRRRLSMNADVTQDLEPLSSFPARFAGGGRVELVASVESPDLKVFRSRLGLKLAGVRVRLPGAGVEADSVEGEIPMSVTLDAGQGGVRIRRGVGRDPFARLRFADRHPLLRRAGFLSIGRLTTPLVSIAPFVGNLAVDQNVVSVRQLEMGVRGGWVAGECALEWDGAQSTLDANLRASGVRSSHGEPLDGNVALVVAARDRTIEGRAEVSRMGRRHLLDLLDMEDPLRVDAAMNGIRSALDYGYPERVRIVFDGGFASARIELGGLARFLSFDELRGIPTGPVVDRLLTAVLDGRAAP
jgi:translocation and assembly module TamB